MAFKYDLFSVSKAANNAEGVPLAQPSSGTPNDYLDAVYAEFVRPLLLERGYLPQEPGLDEFRTAAFDPAPSLKNEIQPAAVELPLNSPELPEIGTSLVDLNPQDATYTNTEFPVQHALGRDTPYQLQPFDGENETYILPSYDDGNQTYSSTSFNDNQENTVWNGFQRNSNLGSTSVYNVNQGYPSAYDVNQPFFSVAPPPSQLNYTPPANFNPLPTWGVATSAAPGFNLPFYGPQAGGSPVPWSLAWSQSASPTRSRRAKARKAPHGAVRSYKRHAQKQPFEPSVPSGSKLVHDCPRDYIEGELPNSGLDALAVVCPSIKHYYKSNSHSCCMEGCPEKDGHYERVGLLKHVKTHNEIEKALETGFKCPIGSCESQYKSPRGLEKHIETDHLDMHVLCAFCLTRLSRQENLGRHFDTCITLYPRPA
ncbi:hypothetical protein CPB85DRAFT_1452618 [Mucidula mucida]|nr:hypothetical protein CPB85DRAFT_1452618 [Mucidula mucida]